ncbi:uncharacterized protein LOC126375531 isoform X1 [Pectinophora gossypiella]|uniref:uncharacterized protein LOC126375531 isoform X1 n=1 Tax=Pectinophora gossypiella TaxID=13191 RepID=UPI00214EF6D7|nr:uncharacterized protein LOC126375531 isoform X1 [Pectinophora gossypiella]
MALGLIPSVVTLFRGICLLRLIFGYYNKDLIRSERVKCLARIYCILQTAAFLIISFASLKGGLLLYFSIVSELTSHKVISFFSNSCPLDYFCRVMSRCRTRKSKNMLLKLLLISYAAVLIFLPIYLILVFCSFIFLSPHKLPIKGMITIFLYEMSLEVARLPKFLSISLLYCDVKSFLMALKGTKSRNNILKFDSLDMYENIYNSFRTVEISVKIQILFGVLAFMPLLLNSINEILNDWKDDGIGFRTTINLVLVSHFASKSFAPIAMLELVAEIEEEVRMFTLDLCFFSPDNRVRSEMRRLRAYMRARPLRYSLWRVVLIDMRLVVGFTSFCATYIIALLQLTHAIKNNVLQGIFTKF